MKFCLLWLSQQRLVAALEPDEVVLGGGNVHKLKKLPPLCRAGTNENAFRGGFRLWEKMSVAAMLLSFFLCVANVRVQAGRSVRVGD